ncbi:unnamed protein product, partial [Brenthis ino]
MKGYIPIIGRPPSHRETVKKSSSSTSEKRRSTEDSKRSESKPKKNLDNDSKLIQTEKQENKLLEEDQEEGQFQLNDLMTRILEEELQTIMIEVWQALPDAPPTEAEKFVADKLRNVTSDNIRNVIGLNVTKRLLNVYNPLIVKLRFNRRPESGCLTKFLNSYNIKSFKRITREANTFSARLASISDFDKICIDKEIRCGGAKITVTPCYKFDKCPSKINSIYNIIDDEDSKEEDNEYNDGENKEIESKTTNLKDSNTKSEKNKDNEAKIKDVSSENKEKSIVSDKNVNKIEENKISNTKKQNCSNTQIKPNKDVQKTTNKTGNAKTIDHKTTDIVKSAPSNKPKVEDAKKILPEKKATTEESKKLVTAKKAIETKKPNKNRSNTEKPKVSQAKKISILQEEQDMGDEEKEVMEDEIKKFDEGDEMNDEEILALVSEGVVVDECTGSDEE